MSSFSFNPHTQVLTSEAGVLLEKAQNHLKTFGYETPYDLGARGSCSIGGNLATCAGGINFLRYGSLRNYIYGLEVVLGDGTILDMMKELPKNNVGLDLKQLFIGSEGTLGIITKLNMLCKPQMREKVLLLLKVRGFENIIQLTKEAKLTLGNYLNALEYLDQESYGMVMKMKKQENKFFKDDFSSLFSKEPLKREEREHYLLIQLTGNMREYLE